MKDFNIAKYLKENYQGPFSMFQPYTDLNPIKEGIKRDQEVKITSGIHAGKTATVHDFNSEKDSASGEDWVDVLIGSKKEKKTVKASELKPLKEESEEQLDTEIPYKGPDPHLDGMGSDFEQAKPVEEVVDGDSLIDTLTQEYGEWLDQNNLPQMSADELLYDDSIKKTPEQEKYLQDFINRWDDAQKNYGTDDDIEENVGAEQGEFDRTIDLFGQKVVDIANEMIDDGYEKEDAIQFLRDMANYIEDNVI